VAANRGDYVGRTFAPTEPYEVSRTKIAEFATAIGEPSPLCHDPEAARRAGYPDVIAPPSFAIVIAITSSAQVTHDSGLGLNYARIVHGEQSFEHARPLHAGDWVVARSTIEDIKELGRHLMVATRTDITTVDGEHVCTARGTLVERGE
jgi:acyl dehydratase